MEKATKYLLCCLLLTAYMCRGQNTIELFKEAVFYDGYANLVNQPTPPEVYRLRNDLITKRIKDEQIDSIGSELFIDITLGALCDNYDRIGGVNLVFVPEGLSFYHPDSVERIEVGRFITPFFNKNIMPDTVPYRFDATNLVKVLRSSQLNAQFDFWLELEVFGVPYAANQQVAGCSGRMDVFEGTVRFSTNSITPSAGNVYIDPLAFKQPFNNYSANATDQLGTTVKTIMINVPVQLYDARLFLITSNHGAGNGGEEYVRRMHYVNFDGNEVLTYLPGGKSCEPYRVYNTQANFIYGSTPQSPSWWTSWNNWCPGDTIPVREISLGDLTAGAHTFQISVPDAQFLNADGNFPLSLYLHGNLNNEVGLHDNELNEFKIFPNPTKDILTIDFPNGILVDKVCILDPTGKLLKTYAASMIHIDHLADGFYIVKVVLADGQTFQSGILKDH